MKVLLTGGAGFIGSHTAIELIKACYEVIIVDNFVNSSRESIRRVEKITQSSIKVYDLDIRDKNGLNQVFTDEQIGAVIHFAGLKAVGESVVQPLRYYDNNVSGSIALFEVMAEFGVKTLVFSSSATVYGDPASVPIREDFPLSATNPYGRSKLMMEEVMAVAQVGGEIAGGAALGLKGQNMGFGQVVDVNIVAHAGAARGRPVLAEHLHRLALARGDLQHERDQVGLHRVALPEAPVRPRHVEVAQADPTELGPSARHVGQQPFADQLRLAVGIGRTLGQVLGHGHALGHPVGGAGGGIDRFNEVFLQAPGDQSDEFLWLCHGVALYKYCVQWVDEDGCRGQRRADGHHGHCRWDGLRQQAIGVKLRHMFDQVVNEPVPDEFLDILRRADERSSTKEGR